MRLRFLLFLLGGFLLAFALGGNALAAPAVDAAQAATGTEQHAKGGLPQFDTTRFPSQIFWMVLTFALTYFLMRNLALPGVARTLEARAARIESDLAAAKAMNHQAKQLAADYEARLNAVRGEAQDIYRASNEENTKKAASLLAGQNAQLEARLRQAEDKLNRLKQEALAGIEQEAAGVVGDLVARLTGMNVEPAALQAAVKQAKNG